MPTAGSGFNWSILFLMAGPYAGVAGLAARPAAAVGERAGGSAPVPFLRVSREPGVGGGVPARRGGVGGARAAGGAVGVAGPPRRYRAHVALAGVSFQVAPGE